MATQNRMNNSTGNLGQVLTGNTSTPATFQNISALSYTSVTLTSLQIKNLHATPITIVPAPGANMYIWPIRVVTKFNYGGNNVFVAGAGQYVYLYLGTAFQTLSSSILDATGVTASSNNYTYASCTYNTAANAATVINKCLNAKNVIATEISGNASNDNTITIGVWYNTYST